MKIWVSLGLITLFFKVSALPVNSPCDPGLLNNHFICQNLGQTLCQNTILADYDTLWNLRFGFYGDYVFDRKLQIDNQDNPGTIHETRIYTNAAYLVLNLCHRFDVFATLGASNLMIEGTGTDFQNSPDFAFRTILDTGTEFSWSLGARWTLCGWKCLCLGVEAQYFETSPSLNKLDPTQTGVVFYIDDAHLKYQEWQTGLGVSYCLPVTKFTFLIPYAAVKWSGVLVDMGNYRGASFILPDLKNQFSTGYAVGTTLVGCSKASITAEIRFVDEYAFHLNGQMQF